MAEHRKLRMAMIGGGEGAFIGGVHRMAAGLEDQIELVAGAFNSDPERSKSSGRALGLAPERVYGTYQDLIDTEVKRADDRVDFVSIVTPNDQHYPMAKRALEAGFAVICDKPLCHDLDQARQFEGIVRNTDQLFGLTHNYVGYPMVKEAKALVARGTLGPIRKVVVEYPQGWLATPLEAEGQKQALWRVDPKRSGGSCSVGDIGTHALNLAEYVSGLDVDEVAADLTSFVPGRVLDDDATMLLRFRGGAKGLLWCSQIAVDEENGLNIRVYGEHGGITWKQEEPNTLTVSSLDGPRRTLRTGANYSHLSEGARYASRLPAGHPEGFVLGFANIYKSFAATLRARQEGRTPSDTELDFPGIREGVRGMAFIDAAVTSSNANASWTKIAVD